MSQHDYIIADAAGSAFLADLNLAFKALAENNYGTTEPAVMYAHMWWADTTADILKKRNAANTGWISYLTLSTGALLGNAATATSASDLSGTPAFFAPITNSLAADVNLSVAGTYYDGPTVAQGSVGKWFVSGTVTMREPSFAQDYKVKLWDGTTLIASAAPTQSIAGHQATCSLSGFINAPAGNLRISVSAVTSPNAAIKANWSSAGKDSTITAIRIG